MERSGGEPSYRRLTGTSRSSRRSGEAGRKQPGLFIERGRRRVAVLEHFTRIFGSFNPSLEVFVQMGCDNLPPIKMRSQNALGTGWCLTQKGFVVK